MHTLTHTHTHTYAGCNIDSEQTIKVFSLIYPFTSTIIYCHVSS